jgi:hypothetical protein
MTLRDRARKTAQDYAYESKIKTAAVGPPINSERRYLRRGTHENPENAILRAREMTWWPDVLGEVPQGDARWWWWFVPEGLTHD